jgi:hypothetical protein
MTAVGVRSCLIHRTDAFVFMHKQPSKQAAKAV